MRIEDNLNNYHRHNAKHNVNNYTTKQVRPTGKFFQCRKGKKKIIKKFNAIYLKRKVKL